MDKSAINADELQDLCPSILYFAVTGHCTSSKLLYELSSESNETDTSPTPAEGKLSCLSDSLRGGKGGDEDPGVLGKKKPTKKKTPKNPKKQNKTKHDR